MDISFIILPWRTALTHWCSYHSGLAVTSLQSNKAHAFAGLCPDTCKFMQTHANTSLLFIVSGCWQVCKYDVVRSNSKTAEMRSVKAEISAFLRNFCSSLLNSCLNSPGLGVWQVLQKTLVRVSQWGDQGSYSSDFRHLPFVLVFSPVRNNNLCNTEKSVNSNSECVLKVRHPLWRGCQNMAFSSIRHLPSTLLTQQTLLPVDCTAIHKSFHRKDKKNLLKRPLR